MDFLFDLDDATLQMLLRNTLASLGWTYIALWSIDQNIQQLVCRVGWYNREMEAGSSSMPESVAQRVFNAYKLSRFPLGTGVPSLACNAPRHIWLSLGALMRYSSGENQREFYRVAGIETVVFIPCGNGVLELGTTSTVPEDEQIGQRISSILAILAPFLSVPPEGTRTTSSSSSLPSRSIDSPESSSLGTFASASNTEPLRTTGEQLNVRPSSVPALDYATAFTPALSFFQPSYQLIRSSGVYIPPQPRIVIQPPGQAIAELPSGSIQSAFRSWRPSIRIPPRGIGGSHFTFRRSVALLRHIYEERLRHLVVPPTSRPPGAPVSSSQVHHMISERRRREKLKESFEALRALLPPGSRRDKASILANTKDYLTSLKSRVEELQQANEQLESALQPHEGGSGGNTAETQQASRDPQEAAFGSGVTVEELTQEERIVDELSLRVVVENPSDTIDVMIAILNYLKEMQLHPISFETERESPLPQFVVNLRIAMPQGSGAVGRSCEQVKEGILKALGGGGAHT